MAVSGTADSCTVPRRHGRITHQPEDVPYGGLAQTCRPILSPPYLQYLASPRCTQTTVGPLHRQRRRQQLRSLQVPDLQEDAKRRESEKLYSPHLSCFLIARPCRDPPPPLPANVVHFVFLFLFEGKAPVIKRKSVLRGLASPATITTPDANGTASAHLKVVIDVAPASTRKGNGTKSVKDQAMCNRPYGGGVTLTVSTTPPVRKNCSSQSQSFYYKQS